MRLYPGHRRKHAAVLAGLTQVPVIIREMSDDDAVRAMVDSNLQREHILPSEKAFAYRMKMQAMNHQGVSGGISAETIGKAGNDSARQVYRYVRLTYLRKPILDAVDQGSYGYPDRSGTFISGAIRTDLAGGDS